MIYVLKFSTVCSQNDPESHFKKCENHTVIKQSIYKDNADTIIGNCDSQIFLGGSEPSTLKDLNQSLGKETIDTFNTGESRGREQSHSLNYQKLDHELMLPEEVCMLDNRYALLFIRGERPVMDLKFDILEHPDIRLTADGKMDPYIHGEPWDAGPSISLVYEPDMIRQAEENSMSIELPDTDYVLLSEEDVEKEIRKRT